MFFFTNKLGKVLKYDRTSIIALHTSIATPSFDYLHETTDLGQMIIMDRQLQPRTINVEFLLKAHDFQDTYLLRDELYKLLAFEDELYLHESAEPFKRWKVILSNEEFAEKGYNYASYSLSFISPLGLAESVATTLNKQEFDADVWQFGQGLTFEPQNYIHDKPRFEINNIGTVAIDPRKVPLKITVLGATKNLQIINHTNGDKWTYKGSTSSNDKIVLDGIYAYKNNKNIFADTNKQLITLEKGKNDIEIKGATSGVMTTFEHRFYYY